MKIRKSWGIWLILLALMLMPSSCEKQDSSPLVHQGITATIFWIGEPATADNAYQDNYASAWDEHWTQHFGGLDDPVHRRNQGAWPTSFVPAENPFYFALPYGEFTSSGQLKVNANRIFWYDARQPPVPGVRSILKNRWLQVTYAGKTVYAQWEDVGPYESDDVAYVFGQAKPRSEQAGLDLSPAAAAFLGINGRAKVGWRFVAESSVPEGPWRQIITTRQVS